MSYLPDSDQGKDEFLANLSAKLPGYAATFGLAPGEIASMLADAAAFRWTLDCHTRIKTGAQQWTAFKNLLRDGPEGTATLPDFPAPPPPPAALPDYGIFKRISRLVARLKASASYTTAIGEDLGIVGPEFEGDLAEGKPLLTVRLVAGGHPEIGWKKGRYDALEIEVDRDGQGFRFLSIDTVPDYTDSHELPSAPSLWKYRAIYRLRDERIGQWSDSAQITVHS